MALALDVADMPGAVRALIAALLSAATLLALWTVDPLGGIVGASRADTPWARALERAAAREQARAAWPLRPIALADGPPLRPSSMSPDVRHLRLRLEDEPGLSQDRLAPWPMASDAPSFFGPDLAAHLRAFQTRHGLAPDGVLGAQTRALLNLDPQARAARLLAARDRVLALPGDGIGREIVVELSRQVATLWSDGAPVSTHRVLIGKADDDNATPEVSGLIDRVVFAPRWIVPRRIAMEELVDKGPGPLASRGFKVVDRHGREPVTSASLARVRAHDAWLEQDPGPSNPLGTVKLLFDNPARVALHDTTAHQLFDHTRRTHTHGCVRVEGVGALAAWIVQHEPGWSLERAQEALTGHVETEVVLQDPVAVHLVDLPAGVDADGWPVFPPDRYGRHASP